MRLIANKRVFRHNFSIRRPLQPAKQSKQPNWQPCYHRNQSLKTPIHHPVIMPISIISICRCRMCA
nr:MAG TPA: hypothetical protein [Caudoviricetes sp.]